MNVELKQELNLSLEMEADGLPKRGDKAIEIHLPQCQCEKCRSYYSYSKGEVKKITPSLYSVDRIRTLDCYEYMMNRKVNKFKELKEFREVDYGI